MRGSTVVILWALCMSVYRKGDAKVNMGNAELKIIFLDSWPNGQPL